MEANPEELSVHERLRQLPPDVLRRRVESLTDAEAAELLRWEYQARPKQLPPDGDWRIWLVLAGRGWGKTRCGAEWILSEVRAGARHVALVGATAADARDVMVEGPSGILAISSPDERPLYSPSTRKLVFPNGAVAHTYSADEPDRLRGPQHDAAWADELAAWRYAETWDQLMFGLRLGSNPRCVVTTTPRPIPIIKALLKSPTTAVTRGNTFENRSNLADAFLEKIVSKYEGTRLGRQELGAELLDDVPGALWTRNLIDGTRVEEAPDLFRVVVGVDPSIAGNAEEVRKVAEDGPAEAGIIVGGIDRKGHGYLLADASLSASPDTWARVAYGAYETNQADKIVAEANQGGEMVRLTIRTVAKNAPVKLVYASKGKHTRAEPVSSLYEQGKVHHVGSFPELEDQMCSWVPGDKSPDRLDAMVWTFTELLLNGGAPLVAPHGIGNRRNPFLVS